MAGYPMCVHAHGEEDGGALPSPALCVCEGAWISVVWSTAAKPMGSLGKEWELAAGSPGSSAAVLDVQVTALLWLTLWVTLGTWELPCICGPR